MKHMLKTCQGKFFLLMSKVSYTVYKLDTACSNQCQVEISIFLMLFHKLIKNDTPYLFKSSVYSPLNQLSHENDQMHVSFFHDNIGLEKQYNL